MAERRPAPGATPRRQAGTPAFHAKQQSDLRRLIGAPACTRRTAGNAVRRQGPWSADAHKETVDEPSGERWALALERLKNGETVSVADVGLRLEESGDLTVMAISAWAEPSNVPTESARSDLGRAKRALDALIDADPTIRSLAKGRPPRLELIADYEIGSELIASMDGDELAWHIQSAD